MRWCGTLLTLTKTEDVIVSSVTYMTEIHVGNSYVLEVTKCQCLIDTCLGLASGDLA